MVRRQIRMPNSEHRIKPECPKLERSSFVRELIRALHRPFRISGFLRNSDFWFRIFRSWSVYHFDYEDNPPSLATARQGTRTIFKNEKSPPDLSVEQGQMGNGSSSHSLSRTGIRRAPFWGLPDSRRHSPGKRNFGLVARAVQRLSAAEFQVRLFSSHPGDCGHQRANRIKTRLRFFIRILTVRLRDSHRFWRRVRPRPRVSPLHS